MQGKTISAREALELASQKVGSRGRLAAIMGIPRASINSFISRNSVSPAVARKLDMMVPEYRCDVAFSEIFSKTMMAAERAKFEKVG